MTATGKVVAALLLAVGLAGAGAAALLPRGHADAPAAEAPAPAQRAVPPVPPPKAVAPEAPPKRPEVKPASRLDEVLAAWARADRDRPSGHYTFTRTDKNRVFETQEKAHGQALFVRKAGLLRIDEWDGPAGKPRQTGVITPKAFHRFDYKTREEVIIPRGWSRLLDGIWKGAPSVYDDAALLAGPGRRVELAREDRWYVYLRARPQARGPASFKEARVVLLRDSYRVRQVWLRSANGNETTLDRHWRPGEVDEGMIWQGLKRGWKRTRVGGPKD
jgi:hypothetical protein